MNKAFKDKLKSHFIEWYAKEVAKSLTSKSSKEKIKKTAMDFGVDLRLSIFKPLHAEWLLQVISYLLTQNDPEETIALSSNVWRMMKFFEWILPTLLTQSTLDHRSGSNAVL